MKEWMKPSLDIINYDRLLIIHEYEADYGEKSKRMDLCRFNGINNRFYDIDRNSEIEYKEIVAWIPVPSLPEWLKKTID